MHHEKKGTKSSFCLPIFLEITARKEFEKETICCHQATSLWWHSFHGEHAANAIFEDAIANNKRNSYLIRNVSFISFLFLKI